MTIETPQSPTSPTSPTSGHPFEDGFVQRTPQLQVVTTFPHNPVLGRRSSVSLTSQAQHTALTTPMSSVNGFRAHREHRHGSIAFPTALDAILLQPLSNLPTPLTPHQRIAIDALLNPTSGHDLDGRQSRMAMRSPPPLCALSPMSFTTPTPLTASRSPILDQIVSLPLRLNTSIEEFDSPMDIDTFSAATTVVPSPPASRATSRDRAFHFRTPAVSHTSTSRNRSPPPKYHVTVRPSLASTLNNTSSLPSLSPRTMHEYSSAIGHLRTTLVPLISVTTGAPHPRFPRSLLQYHLLTHEQLDSLARWYHQVDPSREESFMYPAWIPPYTTPLAHASVAPAGPEYRPSSGFEQVSLATKRRRWGRFIGLRGCESPTEGGFEIDEGERLVERMEREWRKAMRRAREEDAMREKGWRGRW